MALLSKAMAAMLRYPSSMMTGQAYAAASVRYMTSQTNPTFVGEGLQISSGQVAGGDALPLSTGRPRLVVLGTGWGAARLLHDIDPRLYDLTVISQRNHMVFTPLLASTTVGTIDARSVTVHITDIQKALFQPQNSVYIAEALSVDPKNKQVEARSEDGLKFKVKYDKLVIATGSQGSTFGIPGVLEHTHFLRDVHQAQDIRHNLIDNIAKAGVPGRAMEDYNRLLHILIVGGGPTGVEVAGELTDFISQDLKRLYPERARAMRVTIIEAREVLGSFDSSLREYAVRKLVKRGVQLRKGAVKKVEAAEVTLTDGSVIPYGLCIWSTGVGPTPFTLGLPFAKTKVGRIAVDKHLRVLAPNDNHNIAKDGQGENAAPKVGMLTDESRKGPAPAQQEVVPGVYALGDCCANPDNPLPALAQVAEQQGSYLAKVLNFEEQHAHEGQASKRARKHAQPADEFIYRSLGAMATVGDYSGVMELHANRGQGTLSPLSIAGWVSWFAWRSAYLTRLGSMQKRLRVAFNWYVGGVAAVCMAHNENRTLTFIFGRDMSTW